MSSETNASNSSSVNNGNDASSITIDLRPLLEDVSKLMTTHISRMLEGVVGEYTTYKETHDIIMSLPCVKRMQQRVEELESQLNTGSSSNQQNQNQHCTSSSQEQTNDYNETMQLKGAVDELTKYIKHLESCISAGPGAGAGSSGSLPEKDTSISVTEVIVDNETVRLEVHENEEHSEEHEEHEEEEEEEEEEDTKNEIVTVVRADEVVDHDDNNEEECSEDETGDGDVSDSDANKVSEVPDEAEDTEVAVDEEEVDAAVDEEEEAEEEEAVDEEEEEEAAEEAADEEESALEEAVAEEDAAEDEIEVSEVKIKGKTYFTTNAQNGIIYACVNDDVGDEVGVFKNGIALFNSKK
jgi:hypothetical protein